MALWDSSGINTVRLSMMFNQVLNAKSLAIPIGSTNRAVLRCLMGDMTAPADLMKGKSAQFERVKSTTGNKVEVKLMGPRSTYSAVTDGTSSRSASYTSDRFGAAVFDWTHYVIDEDIQVADLYQAQGDDAKTTSLINEYTNFFSEKMRDTLTGSVAGSGDQTTSRVGGINYIVDDSTTYGGIVRTDSTNANFRSYVQSVSGTNLSLTHIRTAQNTVRDRNGSARYAFCDLSTYQLVEKLVETQAGAGFATVDPGEKSVYGAPSFSYNGTFFVYDSYMTAGCITFISPEWWTFFLNDDNFKGGQLLRNTGTKSSYVYFADFYAALVCKNPFAQGKLTYVTA